jgi:hypothetical protein
MEEINALMVTFWLRSRRKLKLQISESHFALKMQVLIWKKYPIFAYIQLLRRR